MDTFDTDLVGRRGCGLSSAAAHDNRRWPVVDAMPDPIIQGSSSLFRLCAELRMGTESCKLLGFYPAAAGIRMAFCISDGLKK